MAPPFRSRMRGLSPVSRANKVNLSLGERCRITRGQTRSSRRRPLWTARVNIVTAAYVCPSARRPRAAAADTRSRPTSSVTSNTCGIFKILNRPSFSRVVSLFCKGRSWETTLTPPFTNHEATFSLNTVGDNVGRGEWKLEKRLTSCLTSDEMDLSSSGLESTMTVPMQLMDPRFGIRDLDTMTGAHLDGGREEGGTSEAGGQGRASGPLHRHPRLVLFLRPSTRPSDATDVCIWAAGMKERKRSST